VRVQENASGVPLITAWPGLAVLMLIHEESLDKGG